MTTDGIQKLSENQSGTFGGKRVGGLRAIRKLASRERLATYLHSRAGAELAVGQKPPLSEPKVRNRTISQQIALNA
jgi:hypothetical protein